jgi:hypothetical protein
MTKITLALEILSDGKWHQVEELQVKLKLTGEQIQKIASLLEQYGFATIDKAKGKIKVDEGFQKLLLVESIS